MNTPDVPSREGLTVRVRFPDGVKSVPGHMHQTDEQRGGFYIPIHRPTPNEMEGWSFHHVIGGADHCDWVAKRLLG